jgi:hypothetical protein
MNTKVREDVSRRIASKEYNKFIIEDIHPHQATQIVPSSFLWSFDDKLKKKLKLATG